MDIRRALSTDAERLTQLAIASKRHWGYSDEFMILVRAELEISAEQIMNGYCEISHEYGVDTGFILLLETNDFVELEALFISPDFIGTGLGSKLLLRSVDWAKANGYQRMQTTADPNALGFYEKYGFVIIGEIASGSIPGRTLPRLELDLNAV
jgi:GNAT superfamily N-acetyltransferase